MIRCSWCGAQNYAIDSWCSNCSRHLDWAPPAKAPSPPPPPRAEAARPEPPHPPRHRRLILLAPALAALVVAIALALPVASWFKAAGRAASPALPNTAMQPLTPTASAASVMSAVPSATPDVTPSPDATPMPDASAPPDESSSPAAPPVAEPAVTVGDPAATVARFYEDVSAHDFAAAAALWTARMQAQYPPATYIDHRFAATERINLQDARMVEARGGLASVYVDVIEVIDGQRRQWVGTWQLVRTTTGWLLNRPNLRAES